MLRFGPPDDFLRSLRCLLEYQYHAPHSRYTMSIFRLLFQVLVRFPQLCRSVQTTLRDTMLYGPRFVPVVIQLIEEYVACGNVKAAEFMRGRFEGAIPSAKRCGASGSLSSTSFSKDSEGVVSRVSCFLLSSLDHSFQLQPHGELKDFFPSWSVSF